MAVRKLSGVCACLGAVLGLLAGNAVSAAAQDESVPNNVELMESAVQEVAKDFIAGIRPHSRGLYFRLQGKTLGGGESSAELSLVDNTIRRELTYHGYRVIDENSPDDPGTGSASAQVFRYQVLGFRLGYKKSYRRGIWGKSMIEREGNVHLYAELIDPDDNAVLWADEKSYTTIDRIPKSELSRVADERYAFANPVVPSRNLLKYAEPVLVTGIVVGLVYLFFANQSDS